MSRQIFISYSHRDDTVVDELVAALQKAGVLYFLDRKDINWGASITPRVQSGLAYSSAVLVVLSPASQKSQWVPYEVGYASALGVEVLPFLTHPDIELPPFMRELNAISSMDQFKAHWTRHRLPPSPLERDLLNGDGKFEWQWAGQNWHGEVSFSTNHSSQVRATDRQREASTYISCFKDCFRSAKSRCTRDGYGREDIWAQTAIFRCEEWPEPSSVLAVHESTATQIASLARRSCGRLGEVSEDE